MEFNLLLLLLTTLFHFNTQQTYVPLDSTEPYVTGSNWANMFGPIWTGKEDGSMVSFG